MMEYDESFDLSLGLSVTLYRPLSAPVNTIIINYQSYSDHNNQPHGCGTIVPPTSTPLGKQDTGHQQCICLLVLCNESIGPVTGILECRNTVYKVAVGEITL